jgi:hypothetical protein
MIGPAVDQFCSWVSGARKSLIQELRDSGIEKF